MSIRGRISKANRNRRLRIINNTNIDQFGVHRVEQMKHNRKARETILKWLTAHETKKRTATAKGKKKKNNNNNKTSLLISGPSGCGKTSCTRLLCESRNFEVIYFNGALYEKTNKNSDYSIEDIISDATRGQSVVDLMRYAKPKKRVIIVDQVDQYLTGSGSRSRQDMLIKLMKDPNKRIILITTNLKGTKMKSIEKYCERVYFNAPSDYELYDIIREFCEQTGMKLTELARKYIVMKIDHDIKQLLIMLYELYKTHINTSEIDYRQVIQYVIDTNKDIAESTIFDSVQKILYVDTLSLKDKLDIYDQFPLQLPMMLQENFLRCSNNMTNVIYASDRFSDADLFHETLYDRMEGEIYIDRYVYGIMSVNLPFTADHRSNRIQMSKLFGLINKQRAVKSRLASIRCSTTNNFSDIDMFVYGGRILEHHIDNEDWPFIVNLANTYGFKRVDKSDIALSMFEIAKRFYRPNSKYTKPKSDELEPLITEFKAEEQHKLSEQIKQLKLSN